MVASSLMTLGLAGCGGGQVAKAAAVQIAKGAVAEVGSVVGQRGVTTIELSSEQVARLANQANVADDVIRTAAPVLDESPLWSRSIGGLKTVYTNTPGEIRATVAGMACDGVRRKITTVAQLEQNLVTRFAGYSKSQISQLTNDVLGLYKELDAALVSTDPSRKASAVLFCFTVEQAVG